MSRYDVYGIGNALVDMEYRIEPDELERLGIDKGVMTLIDVDHQSELMVSLADHHVHRSAGGSAANTVIAVSQFGGRGFYTCKIGNDELGRLYAADLEDNGVDTNARSGSEPGHTGRCLVFVTPDADRTMLTFLGITGGLGRGEVDEEALKDSSMLYIEGYLATSDTARDAVVHAREIATENGVRTAISLSDPTIVNHFRGGLEEMIGPGVDLLFSNEDEAMDMTRADSFDEAFAGLQGLAREFVVTRGARSAVAWNGKETIEIPTQPVTPLDTVGAGDMFAGAFLHARSRGQDHAAAGALASTAAARLIRTWGPRLGRDEARAILAEVDGETTSPAAG